MNEPGAAGNRQWFHGKAVDNETGLSYFGARYYDSSLGRFMGVDAVPFHETNLQSFNRYAYANNNPYKFTDPDGRVLQFAQVAFNLVLRGLAWIGARQAGTVAVVEGTAAIATGAAAPSVAIEVAAAKTIFPMVRGRQSETKVLKELGLQKNKEKVTTADGTSIPDAITDTQQIEIKDTISVPFTRQLRIQTEAARAAGKESVLITGTNSKVHPTTERAFDTIIRRDDLGPKQ